MNIIRCTRRALLAALLPLVATTALADAWPSRPIKLVVPFPAGGPTDTASRILGQKLAERLKQPVVVENKPGASGTLGMSELNRAPADGYTVGAMHFASVAIASLFPNFKVDLAKDIVGVGQIEWGHNILVVSPSLGLNSAQELIEYLKKNPGQFGSSGVGSPAHLSGVMFLRAAGIDATHVPYNQFGQAITDVATGRVTFMILAAPAAVPQVLGGRLKALAATSPARNPNLKDVPTFAELKMPTVQSRTWSGLVVRAGTPKDIVDRLSRDIASVMAMPDIRELLLKQQIEIPTESVDQFRDLIRRDVEFGANFVKANNIRLE